MSLLPWVRLLAVFWAAAQCGAVQEGPAPDPGTSLNGTLDLLWTGVDRVVKSAVEPLIADLNTRLDSVKTKLDSVQSELVSNHADIVSRLDSVHHLLAAMATPVNDCTDLPAGTASGVHLLRPGLGSSVPAYCDMETDGGGWTVIQRRIDVQPRQDFYLGWDAYKQGFGAMLHEFWWGNDNIWRTTSLLGRRYTLRVDLEDFDGERGYAVYQNFTVASEADGYRLAVGSYSGDAGDSLRNHAGMRFSTKDNDQDSNPPGDCAWLWKGGWWYNDCFDASLNGRYRIRNETSSDLREGVIWGTWRGYRHSLKGVEMKIRPTLKI